MATNWADVIAGGEKASVDFKGPTSWEGDSRAKLLNPIIGMSNIRNGGSVLVGVDNSGAVIGMTADQLASFDPTKIADYVSRFVEPSVAISVEKPLIGTERIVVLVVSEFATTPTICTVDGPEDPDQPKKRLFYAGSILVRTTAAKTVRVSTAEQMNELIRLAVTKRADALLHDVRRIVEGRIEEPGEGLVIDAQRVAIERWEEAVRVWKVTAPPSERRAGTREVRLVPLGRPGSSPMDPAAMRRAIERSVARLGHWHFPEHANARAIVGALEKRLDLPGYREMWQLHETGAFMFIEQLREDVGGRGTDVPELGYTRAICQMALVFSFADRLMTEVDFDGSLRYEVDYFAMSGRKLVAGNPMWQPTHEEHVAVSDRIPLTGEVSRLDLKSDWEGVSVRVAQKLLGLFQFDLRADMARNVINHARKGNL